MRRIGVLVVVAALAVLGACHLSEQSEAAEVAGSLCRCLEPDQPACAGQLETELGSNVAQDCIDCVFDHERTCASMLDDCAALCIQNVQTPGGTQ